MKTISTIVALLTLLLFQACGVRQEVDYSTGQVTPAQMAVYFGSDPYLPDIETFMQIGHCYSPGLSPDGQRIFFQSSQSGVNQLYTLTESGWPYQLTMFVDGIDWYVLSPTGNLAIIGADVGGSEDAQLFLIDTRTGRVKQLTNRPEVRYLSPLWSRDEKTLYFASNEENGRDFKLFSLFLETGAVEKLMDVQGWCSWVDLSLDGRQLLYTRHAGSVNNDLYLYEIETGEVVHLTPHDGDIEYTYAHFSADASRLFLICNDNPQGLRLRAEFDLETNALTWLDNNPQWDVESLVMSPDRTIMAWIVNENGYGRLMAEDIVAGKALPVPSLDGIMAEPVLSGTPNILFSYNSATRNADVWSWSFQSKELKQLTFSSYAGIDRTNFSEPQLIHYQSFDGLEIPAFLYLPPNYKKGEPVPFIMDIHGGPEGQFRPYFSRHFQYLMSHGFGILAPNVRGSDGYGREYLAMDNYKNRLNSVKDMKAGADWLIASGYSRQGMIGIKGASYGGYMTMAAITEYPGFFSAAIDEVGIVNFVTYLENTAEYRRYLRESEYGPLSDRNFLTSISPIHKVDLITTPLMVVHGENDPRVPVAEAHQIIEAIQRRGGIVKPLIFPDEGHGVSKRSNSLILYRQMVEFFEEHLKQQ